jgi:hypothetical protein
MRRDMGFPALRSGAAALATRTKPEAAIRPAPAAREIAPELAAGEGRSVGRGAVLALAHVAISG